MGQHSLQMYLWKRASGGEQLTKMPWISPLRGVYTDSLPLEVHPNQLAEKKHLFSIEIFERFFFFGKRHNIIRTQQHQDNVDHKRFHDQKKIFRSTYMGRVAVVVDTHRHCLYPGITLEPPPPSISLLSSHFPPLLLIPLLHFYSTWWGAVKFCQRSTFFTTF